jgi:gamma-glutamyltranspeptidase
MDWLFSLSVAKNAGAGVQFGSAQLICSLEHGYTAGSDHRRDGQAIGF